MSTVEVSRGLGMLWGESKAVGSMQSGLVHWAYCQVEPKADHLRCVTYEFAQVSEPLTNCPVMTTTTNRCLSPATSGPHLYQAKSCTTDRAADARSMQSCHALDPRGFDRPRLQAT